MKYVGYYTPGPYQREAELLRLSLDAKDLPHDIREYPSRGSWQANTQMKSEVIGDFLNVYPDEPIVYLDVDASVLQYPHILEDLQIDLEESPTDIAAHLLDNKELLSGTVYFGNTVKCREVVTVWQRLCKQWPDTIPAMHRMYSHWLQAWDQRLLQMAVREIQVATNKFGFYNLPPEYCFIYDISKRYYPNVKKPVILHSAASRLYRDESKIPKI